MAFPHGPYLTAELQSELMNFSSIKAEVLCSRLVWVLTENVTHMEIIAFRTRTVALTVN